ncbi:methyl-accepting chemotaxis protein [Desulfobacula toluolica]|uniref:Putative methyl-accepting chemotaxis sensory transducer n=1 Tax=Desulfobacula toluolica (strain DSM 7467 / Tol2) TaxID=651182 RepID=K0NC46_DESTT|nr:methyl-accepting chemotaxis protein [Desulfobacula toluolica]CCK78175.1 putative methyl-accepting chemotaxis sensory transducer [Desulfobacula toluolica Tol2]
MFKNMKLGTKIMGLAGLLIILCGLVAYAGYYTNTCVVDRVHIADDVNQMVKTMLETRRHEKNYIIREKTTYLEKVNENIKALKQQILSTKEEFTDLENKNRMDDILSQVNQYEQGFSTYVNLNEKIQKFISVDNKMVQSARLMEKTAAEIHCIQREQYYVLQKDGASAEILNSRLKWADDTNLIIQNLLQCRRQEKNFLLREDMVSIDKVSKFSKKIIELAENLRSVVQSEESKQKINSIINFLEVYKTAFDNVVHCKKQQVSATDQMVASARAVQKICSDTRANQKAKMNDQISFAGIFLGLTTLSAAGLGIFLSFFITRGITKYLSQIIENLETGSQQVSAASSQISSASQSLAEGSTEQAASIEETSASLEQISSMVKQNSENSGLTNTIMQEVSKEVKQASVSMGQLTQSIDEISKSSEETSKIVKTIDEIAFQTNLLALNAAVEAARAGDAGAGFAVVADEVRNLAMRAADAAKNTTDLIEDITNKINIGSGMVVSNNESFSRVAKSSIKASELVNEITAASKEQSEGIEQLNIAVTEVDKVIQQNAATAEESASTSEELNAQAEQMKYLVHELVIVVNGSKNRTRKPDYETQTALMESGKREIRSDQLISCDDDDFKNF